MEQASGHAVALGGAAQGIRSGCLVAFGEQQFGPPLRDGRLPGAARPATRAVLGALQELAAALELAGAGAHGRGGQGIGRLGRMGQIQRGSNSVSARLNQGERRAGALVRYLQQHAVDEEQQMLGEGRHVREFERPSSCARAPDPSPR